MGNVTSSGNPVWAQGYRHAQANPFQPGGLEVGGAAAAPARTGVMTVGGSVNASFILLGLCGAAFIGGWSFLTKSELAMPILAAGGIPGFIIAIILCFKPMAANILGPIYAVLQGLFLGAASHLIDNALAKNEFVVEKLGGSVAGAAGLMTLAVFGGMLGAYKLGIIKATKKFQAIMGVAIIGVLIFSLVSLVMSLFGVNLVKLGSPLGIAVSCVIGLVAAFTLILDFHFIEEGSAMGLPKKMEWYGAFGLLSTLIWLYVSILRILIAIAASRE